MDDLTGEELEQLLGVFRDQSLHILDEMSQDLISLERSIDDFDALERLRRSAHTIKGDSACIGLEAVCEIAHRIEDLFESVVSEKRGLGAGVVDGVLAGLDAIRAAISGERVEDVQAEVAAELVERLKAADVAADVAAPKQAGRESLRREDIEASGEEKKANGAESDEVDEAERGQETGEGRDEEKLQHAEKRQHTERRAEGEKRQRREFVRVEAAKVDALLNLAGEMVIARSVINQIGGEVERALPRHEGVARLAGACAQMGSLVAEFQKSVLKMRMTTMDQVFKRFTRPMRELAAVRGKSVEIEIRGTETEIDRAMVDLLYEPLLHLLRNAVDHGLEPAEERLRSGKAAAGRIRMRAYHEANQVVVEITDDGRGIDADCLKRKAVESGAISESDAEGMERDQALDLIFLPGFSTAGEVTQVSGRGVGASAARSAVEQMRGTLSVRSEAGAGTTFVIRLPLTLAIIRALLFRASGQLFALPLLGVSEIVRAEPSDVTRLDGFENYRLRDRFISLARPGAVLGFERRKGGSGAAFRQDARFIFIIVLAVGGKKYGVIADEVVAEQELVIKPLDSRWVENEALAGASVLGDGRVVLILDAEMVFRKAVKYERSRGRGKGVYGA